MDDIHRLRIKTRKERMFHTHTHTHEISARRKAYSKKKIKEIGNRPDNWEITFQPNFPPLTTLLSKYRYKRKEMEGRNIVLHE